MTNNQQWIWQHNSYPSFKYNIIKMFPKVKIISEKIGQIKALISLLDSSLQDKIQIDLFTDDIVSTSAIEGENLSRDSVRSSIRKKLDKEFSNTQDKSTYHTDALANIFLDATTNKEPLSTDRLHRWHIALLSHTSSRFTKIKLGEFRDYDDMQIVSGAIGKEKVHYVGLPSNRINKDIDSLLNYINQSDDDIYIKSAIAHLWFVTIHPYDDGNGRIARTISDYIISKEFGINYKYFSISSAIAKDRKNYYNNLESTQSLIQNPNLDCNRWIEWYLDRYDYALSDTLNEIHKIFNKTKFWDKVRDISLNQRQLKVLNKLLEFNEGEFQGALTTKKYVAMTKTSLATAKRDIQDLVEHNCIKQVEGTKGRNIKYEIVFKRQ